MSTRNWDVGQLLEVSGGYWETCALHAGVELDLFTIIGDKQLSPADIASGVDADTRALAMLLNALSAMALLEKKDDTYGNTEAAATLLSKASAQYLGHIIMHHHHLVDSWSRLAEAVKDGGPLRSRASVNSDAGRESFLMGMFNMAMGLAPRIVPKIDVSSCHHLLDLGGGPGTYAIFFCQHNPDLKATVYDLPTTRPFAEKTIARFDMADRVDFVDGNFVEEGIDGTYDAVWLSHILHGESPESCQSIIRKAVSALGPGGKIIIHEFILNNAMDGPLFPALFSLNMLLGTPGGQAYGEQHLIDMLTGAGVKNIQRIDIGENENSGIISGEV
ncbi:MAG: methyltransferase [Desulfobacterales bacterium]